MEAGWGLDKMNTIKYSNAKGELILARCGQGGYSWLTQTGQGPKDPKPMHRITPRSVTVAEVDLEAYKQGLRRCGLRAKRWPGYERGLVK